MKGFQKFCGRFAALAAVAATAPAMATNVYVDAQSGYGTASIKFNGTSLTTATTGIDLSYNSKSFEAFCMELEQGVTAKSTVSYSIGPYINDGISRLFAVAGFNGASKGTDFVTTMIQKSALQLAIWEVVYDGVNGSFNSGRFSINSTSDASAFSQARTYLTAAANLKTGQYATNLLQRYSSSQYQDLVSTVGLAGVSAIPEPETAFMWLGGVAALVLVRRRRQQGVRQAV